MAQAAASGELAAHDAVGWCERAAAILRDETSGICFRSTTGFCSTGSQISWLRASLSANAPADARSAAQSSHLFTAASDPLVASYKRFTFADAALDGAASSLSVAQGPPCTSGAVDPGPLSSGNRSLELWNCWRRVALKGGLARVNGATAAQRFGKHLAEQETTAMLAVATEKAPRSAQDTFAEAVAKEVAALNEMLAK